MDTEELRLSVYEAFRTSGRAPNVSGLANRFDDDESEVRRGLGQLAVARHLVLDSQGEIAMAHPFSAVPLGFAVMGKETLWWGGCSWDSFALAHLLVDEPDLLVATRCPHCGRAGSWVVSRERPPEGDWLAHFLVPAARMWDDVVHTCRHQRLFCSEHCVATWLDSNQYERGYVMDLATLWRFASSWYEGRLDRGYVRREPSDAVDYFRSVGLGGPFWGT